MSRVLVFTDRDSEDSGWKGALIWQTILGLAESQHEVMVASPLESDRAGFTHPRLTVTRPVTSWRADQIVPLTRLLFTYQPQVIQTFALKTSAFWPALSVWPYLQGLCRTMPHLQRISTLFDEDDAATADATFRWHQSAHTVTVFSEHQRARCEQRFGRQAIVVPMEITPLIAQSSPLSGVIVPAPVSEWHDPQGGLLRLARFCGEDQSLNVHILGGWGDWTARQRKQGWICLQKVAERVRFHPDFSFNEFATIAQTAERLWLEPLRQDSWRYLLATTLGAKYGRKMTLPGGWTPSVNAGSTANSLARIYLKP